MFRMTIVLLALGACAGKSKGPELAPLPPDKAAAPADAGVTPDAAEEARGPIEHRLEVPTATVKLLTPGRGKRAPLRYTPKPGTKQQVEIALDFAINETGEVDGKRTTNENTIPTIVLAAEVAVDSVDTAGALYVLTVTKADALDVKDSKLPVDVLKTALQGTVGLTLAGTLAPNGKAENMMLRLDKPVPGVEQVIELIMLAFPAWPTLPTEPVAPGAKWQTITPVKLAGRIDVNQITDYELGAYKDGAWTMKGTTKISGTDQSVGEGKVTKIGGAGKHEIQLADGAVYPKMKVTLDAKFTASDAVSDPGKKPNSVEFTVKITNVVTPK